MRAWILTALALSLACVAQANDKQYQQGTLLKMDSANCGYAESDGKTIAGEIAGTDGQKKKTQEVLCQEYVLQSDKIVYKIRPKDGKHTVLLPIGETAEFRIHKDTMQVRTADGKEHEYIVVSMTARTDNAANQSPATQSAAKTPNQ